MRVAKKYVLSLIMKGLRWRTDNDLMIHFKIPTYGLCYLKRWFFFYALHVQNQKSFRSNQMRSLYLKLL